MSSTPQCGYGPSEKPKGDFVRPFGRERVKKQTQKILLVMVDDDEDDCVLVEAALREACTGCTFGCVQNGIEIMEYLYRKGRYRSPADAPRPDVILLDLNMPGMDGFQVLQALKADPSFRAIPVIVFTTSRDPRDIKACYELGANSYITKQPSFDGLLSAIRTFKEYWLDVATLPPRIDI